MRDCTAPNCRCITPCEDASADRCHDCDAPVFYDTEECDDGRRRCDEHRAERALDSLEGALDGLGAARYQLHKRTRVLRPCRVCNTWTPLRLTAFGSEGIESVDLCRAHLSQLDTGATWRA